jgi:hypothetical protein
MFKSILGFENWTKKCPKSKNGNTFQLFLLPENSKTEDLFSFFK